MKTLQGYRRRLLSTCVFVFLIMGIVFLPVLEPVHAQEGIEPSPLVFDGSANPPQAQTDEDINVQLILVGNPDLCEPVETRRPLDIALVVDRSGSMEDPLGDEFQGNKLEGAIQAVDRFLDLIDPTQDRVGLVAFTGNGSELSGLGSATQVRAAFESLLIGTGFLFSGTNIDSGIRSADSLVARDGRSSTTASSVLILLTDGQQTGGNALSAAQDAKSNNIRIIAIGLGPQVDENLLRQVVSQPSDYYYAPETSELDSIYESIVRSIQVFDPATDIEVTYHFDASNFDLVEGSIVPPADVSVNVVTWKFDSLESNQQQMSLSLRARVPGTYYAAPSTEIRFLACAQAPQTDQYVNRFPIDVSAGEGVTAPVCAGIPISETSFLVNFCEVPWGIIGGLLVGLALLLLWLAKYWDQIRAWFRCRVRLGRCLFADLPWRIWLAILAGILVHTLTHSVCESKEGIVFWRVMPDRTSALFLKSTTPEFDPRPLTPLVGEEQCVGCHTTSQSNQSIAAIEQGTNGLLTRFDLTGDLLLMPSLQGSYPSWSPDGTRLAFAANNEDIYILDAESGMAIPLPGASEPGVVESMPTWSADGQRIAFVRAAGSDQNITITTPSDILSVPAQGGTAKLIPGASGLGFNYHPAYSPDGKWLAFTHHEDGDTTYGEPKAEIYLIPAEGGAPRRLQANDGPGSQKIDGAGNTYPNWSQDSQTLFFSSRRCDDQYDIYSTTIDENGNSGPAERLTSISDPQAFEYGAHQIHILQPSLLDRLLALWPWLIPLVLLWLLSWLVCRQRGLRKESRTVQMSTLIKPSEGWLRPRQRFEITLELLGIPGCERQVIKRDIDAVLLLDSSGSMEERDMGRSTRLTAAKKAAARFVRCVVGPKERIAVINFDDDVQLQQNLTHREGDLQKSIKAIEIGGTTAMHLGLQKAAEILSKDARANAIKVIILLSDGEPDDPDSVLRIANELRESGVRIVTVGIGDADDDLLRNITGDSGSYQYVSDNEGLAEAFLTAGRQLIMPPAATQITLTHSYDAEKFELIPGSITPQPQNLVSGEMAWQLDELDTRPRYFRYLVRPLQAGENYVDQSNDITYKRCGTGSLTHLMVEPSALVNVRQFDMVLAPSKTEETYKIFPSEKPEVVWEPDNAVFIGIGGTGRWVLTHLRKNLMDAGGGRLLDGLAFLVIDTDEREKIGEKQVPVSFAGIEISSDDVFVLDENLRSQISSWAQLESPHPEYKGWLDARAYEALGQELNLAQGTYGRRALPRAALIRNLQGVETLASRWCDKRHKQNLKTDFRKWLYQRCNTAYREDRDQVRIFIVASLAGGMSGILVDVANLVRQIGGQIITPAGEVRIEGYIVDGMPYEGLPGGQDTGDQRLANTFASWREIATWQMNPAMPLDSGWGEDHRITKVPFDDLVLFSAKVGDSSSLNSYLYPAIADVITARLDRATGAGEDADWFNLMQRACSDRQTKEHALITGAASVNMLRLPVADILRVLHARWAHSLIRLFLTGTEDKPITFDHTLINDPEFSSDPAAYVSVFLNGVGDFGGEAPVEAHVLADFILMETSDLIGSDELKQALDQDDENVSKNIETRLGEAIRHILYGSRSAPLTGSRAARLQYAILFLDGVERQMRALKAQFENEWNHPKLAHIAQIYRANAESRKNDLENLRSLLSNNAQDPFPGLLDELDMLSTQLESIETDLAQLTSRQYFWGMKERDEYGREYEKGFLETWWNKYLGGTVEKFLPYLGWRDIEAKNLDLEIRFEENTIYLSRDGTQAMIAGLMRMAESLTREAWGEAILADVLESHLTLESLERGQKIREQTNANEILGASGDPGVAEGRLLYIATPSVQNKSTGKPFIEGIRQRQPSETLAVNFSNLEGTDRTSVTVLRLYDALRLDRLPGYQRAERAYDRLDGWDFNQKKFVSVSNGESRAVMRSEAEARRLELGPDFPHTDELSHKIHPLVVASLQSPAWTEIYCLALADGLVSEDPDGQIFLSTGQNPLVLLKSRRSHVDPFVDALLNWTLKPDPSWQPWYQSLTDRFQSPGNVDRSRLELWISRPQPPLERGLPDRISLGKVVTAHVRYFLRTNKRRWQNE